MLILMPAVRAARGVKMREKNGCLHTRGARARPRQRREMRAGSITPTARVFVDLRMQRVR